MNDRRLSLVALAAVVVIGVLTVMGTYQWGLRTARTEGDSQISEASPTSPPGTPGPAVSEVGAGTAPAERFVGRWLVHGETFEIGADLVGVSTWNAGPCGEDMCTGRETLRFQMEGDGLVGEVLSVTIEDGAGNLIPAHEVGADGLRQPGDTVRVTFIAENVLQRTYEPAAEGNPYLCAADAPQKWKLECNI